MKVKTIQLKDSRMMKVKSGIVASLMIGLYLVSLLTLSSGQAYAAKANARTKRSLALQLYNLTGAGKEKIILSKKKEKVAAAYWANTRLLRWLGFHEIHIDIIKEIYTGAFKPNAYYGQILKKISKNYHRAHIRKSIQFFKSSVGRKAVKLSLKSMKATEKLYKNFLDKLMDNVQSKDLLELWDRLATAMGTADLIIDQQISLLRLTTPVSREFNAPDTEILINRLRSEFRERIRSLVILGLVYQYGKLSERELTKLVKFYESPAGQWFKGTRYEGYMAGYSTVNRVALKRMEKIMKVIESGHQSIETTRVVFAPGLRHLFSDKRDPFQPLVTDIKPDEPPPAPPSSDDDGPQINSVEQLAEEIAAIPSIPLEIYERVKEADPRLYADLEFYGTMFKNKNTLAKMKIPELKEEIEQYTALIRRANEEIGQLVVTPLQAALSELTLAGVIWDQKETVGLIETADTKGHTVRVGTFLGPEYGKVESIDEERIVVLEQSRKYDGQVVTATQYIEFPKSDSEE